MSDGGVPRSNDEGRSRFVARREKTMTTQITAICCLILIIMCIPARADIIDRNTVAELHRMPDEPLQTRWFTFENKNAEKGGGGKARFGRKGAPATSIGAGDSFALVDVNDSGTIRRIWLTTHPRTPEVLRGVRIEMYWDDAKTPAVQAPLGDFFCHSMGQIVPFENACFSSPEGRSYNSIVTMPFKKNAKIVLVNETSRRVVVYYDVACTLGDKHGDDMLYFHSYWRRENMTSQRKDMTILPRIEGRGRFLGCNLGIRLHPALKKMWWGEGEVKVYLDGDREYPTLCGTGTEDYVGSGWGQEHFINTYQGNQYVSENRDAYGFYRFHIPDPIYFYEDIKVDIQVMAGPSYGMILEAMDADPTLKFMKAGKGDEFYTREELEAKPGRAEVIESFADYSATAYWYMDKPENGLPPMAEPDHRTKDLP